MGECLHLVDGALKEHVIWGKTMINKRWKSWILLGPALGLMLQCPLGAAAKGYTMSYLFHGNPAQYASDLQQTAGALDVVAPAYFKLQPNGSLRLSEAVDPDFIRETQADGVKVVPYLSNDWDRNLGIQAIHNREQLAVQLSEAVLEYHLDGVTIDIENVTKLYRDEFTQFVRLVRGLLPDDKEVSVAVGANPRGTDQDWLGLYDYSALAEASDHLFLMTYDEVYEGSIADGPIASLSFVEASIHYALTQAPPEKIVLGVPFFGRLWKEDGSILGMAVQNSQVEMLINRYSAAVVMDEASGNAKASFTIGSSDPLPVVNRKQLAPGNYVVWYEDEQSLKQKLSLADRYGLKGTGSWSLSQEAPGIWDFYRLWSNGAEFEDSEGHWAQNAIASAFALERMKGRSESSFAPDESVTRAEAVTVLARILGHAEESAAQAPTFQDVPASHWAADSIAWAETCGIITGMAPGTFAPELPLTREQMAEMAARLLQLSPVSDSGPPFSDVPANHWSYEAIVTLAGDGIIDGFEDGTYRPQAPLTRAQLAVFMDRAGSQFRLKE